MQSNIPIRTTLTIIVHVATCCDFILGFKTKFYFIYKMNFKKCGSNLISGTISSWILSTNSIICFFCKCRVSWEPKYAFLEIHGFSRLVKCKAMSNDLAMNAKEIFNGRWTVLETLDSLIHSLKKNRRDNFQVFLEHTQSAFLTT